MIYSVMLFVMQVICSVVVSGAHGFVVAKPQSEQICTCVNSQVMEAEVSSADKEPVKYSYWAHGNCRRRLQKIKVVVVVCLNEHFWSLK